jgi:catechol 2,3-dioxygenase-like lactoylglutathione lyase family enzyme
MALTLSHAVLHVRDMETMVDWYTKVLGFEVTDRGPMGPNAPEIVFLSQDPGEHHQLAFAAVPPGEKAPGALNHLAFRAEGLDEVRALVAAIVADGRGRAPAPMPHGNTWSAYFADPEGNGVEIFCDTPWHVRQPQGRAWDWSKDDAALIAETRAAFETAPGFGPGDAYVEARKRVKVGAPA